MKKGAEQIASGFDIRDYDADGRTPEQVRQELIDQIRDGSSMRI